MDPFLLPLGSVHLRAMGGRAEALEAPGAANLVPGGAPPVAAPRAPAPLPLLPPPSDPLTPFHGCSRAPPGAAWGDQRLGRKAVDFDVVTQQRKEMYRAWMDDVQQNPQKYGLVAIGPPTAIRKK